MNWIALTAVLVGTALAYVGFDRILTPDPLIQTLETPIRTVAPGVTSDATETNSIGQQRVVRTSDGQLLALYANEAGLNVVSDLGDQGRSWRTPVTLPAIQASSLSAAIDDRDRVQLAFVNDDGAAFTALSRVAGGWQSSNIVQLDSSSSQAIDVAWDQERGVAHVVWVSQQDGRQIRWASVSSGNIPKLESSEALASVQRGDALVNVATGPEGQTIVTYRKGDEPGWFSRSLGAQGWQPEEALPIDFSARAGSLAVDRRGIAHLLLIDGLGEQMIYLKRSNRGWVDPVTVIAPGTTEEMDDPFLAADATSRLLYAFFSTTGTAEALRVVLNDPAGGWEDPYRISLQDNSTQGHSPTSLDPLTGTPLVLWTGSGTPPSIHSGNIVLP